MILHKNKAFQEVIAGNWHGVQEIKTVDREPMHRWSGPKIPIALARQIIAFFEWSQKETQSETVVHLFTNGTEWQALVLPQEGHTGMTVKLLDDHPNRIPTYQRLGRGWSPAGTWHHHCTSPAFASGTDTNDELTKEGVHLTTGDLGKPHYSVHARASFRHTITPIELSDWFESPVGLAPHIRSKQIEWDLCRPTAKAADGEAEVELFPAWWCDNVIKVERARPLVLNYGNNGYTGGYVGGYDAMARKKGFFDTRLENLSKSYRGGVSADDVIGVLRYMASDELTKDVADLLAWSELTVEQALEHLGAAEEKEPQSIDEAVADCTGHVEGCICPTCGEEREVLQRAEADAAAEALLEQSEAAMLDQSADDYEARLDAWLAQQQRAE